jgi:hypothetical protein
MFSFTTNPTITITFDGQEGRSKKNFKLSEKETVEIPIYGGQENISGVVDISVPAGKKIEHQGIRIEMIGQTGNGHYRCFLFAFHNSNCFFFPVHTACRIVL